MTPSLRDTQRWMQARILPAERKVEPVPAAVALNPQGGDPGEARLSVYAQGYEARMEEALAEVYEAVRHVLGRRAFSAMANGYAAGTPSRDYNLSLAGRHLPGFLAAYPLTRKLPFLPDLARLEWSVAEAFHAFEQAPFQAQEAESWSEQEWMRTRLVFQDWVRLAESAWPILDIWQARHRPVSEVRVELKGRPQRVLVRRSGFQVSCELLEENKHALLKMLLAGSSLGDLCELLAQRRGDPTLPLTEWFAEWIRGGLIVRCERAGAV